MVQYDDSYEDVAEEPEAEAAPAGGAWHASLPRWARYLLVGLVVTPALEFMVVIGLVFWRIVFGVFEADPALFVDVMNTFGSSFVNAAAFGAGAGGAFGLVKGLPNVLARFKVGA
jgi:hypothetical protein